MKTPQRVSVGRKERRARGSESLSRVRVTDNHAELAVAKMCVYSFPSSSLGTPVFEAPPRRIANDPQNTATKPQSLDRLSR